MKANVTQKQVAQRMGLSPTMVGRALRDDAAYSRPTRERIQKVAQEMGYRLDANDAARQMASRRHNLPLLKGAIGCFSRLEHEGVLPFNDLITHGITSGAHHHGLEMMLLSTRPSVGWERVDGIIVFDPDAEVRLQAFRLDIPRVTLLASHDRVDIAADDRDGIRQAVEHLLALGHQKIGYLIDPIPGLARARLEAFEWAMPTYGHPLSPGWQWELFNVGTMEVRGYFSIQAWLRSGFVASGITALLVQNDRAAIGAMRALQEWGLQVPADVSVVGFDGTGEGEWCTPQLTTVHVPLEAMGRYGAELLVQRINQQEGPASGRVLPVQLEVRGSTAPPKPV